MLFYTVDRKRIYKVGQVIHLMMADPQRRTLLRSHQGLFHPEHLAAHVKELFPTGLSYHGWQYLTELAKAVPIGADKVPFTPLNHAIELTFEYVRRAAFPKQPSRMQTFQEVVSAAHDYFN
jgi:hypothetical protein